MVVLLQCMVPIAIILIIKLLCDWLPDMRFNNYMPPEGQKIDYNAQALDKVKNNLTNEQVMRNTVNGKYNVKR